MSHAYVATIPESPRDDMEDDVDEKNPKSPRDEEEDDVDEFECQDRGKPIYNVSLDCVFTI